MGLREAPSKKEVVKTIKLELELTMYLKPAWDFSWKDISNVSQFRYLVRTTQPQYVTIGYDRKYNTTEPTAAKQKSRIGGEREKETFNNSNIIIITVQYFSMNQFYMIKWKNK